MVEESPDIVVTLPIPGESDMADPAAPCPPMTGSCAVNQHIVDGTALVVHELNQGFAAAATRRNDGSDFIAESQRLSHMRASETVSYREAQGQQAVNESGSGQTRREVNNPTA